MAVYSPVQHLHTQQTRAVSHLQDEEFYFEMDQIKTKTPKTQWILKQAQKPSKLELASQAKTSHGHLICQNREGERTGYSINTYLALVRFLMMYLPSFTSILKEKS